MKFKIFLYLFFIISSIYSPFIEIIYAHPGNTDSNGGHTCHTNCSKWGLVYGEYHYHNSYGGYNNEINYDVFDEYDIGTNYDDTDRINSQITYDVECPIDYESVSQSVKNDCYELSHQLGYWQGYIDAVYNIDFDGDSFVYDEANNGILDEISFQVGYEKGRYEAKEYIRAEEEKVNTSSDIDDIVNDIESNGEDKSFEVSDLGADITLLILLILLILAIILWFKYERNSNALIFAGVILLILFGYLFY